MRAAPRAVPQPSMTEPVLTAIPVLAVTFRNAADVTRCLHALSRMTPEPPFNVFICENGGADAFDELVATLTAAQGPCDPEPGPPLLSAPRLARMTRLQLRTGHPSRAVAVHVGEARDNFGYAGGVNAYLVPLLAQGGWPGIWILNPDTEPSPDALKELVAYAESRGRGMVGSRLVAPGQPDIIQTRGLAWRTWRAATRAVDRLAPAAVEPPPEAVEGQLDAPSGASIYVTRDCIVRTGLMDEHYFLYFEDLDWGLRAKRHGPIGYAHRSIVQHEGGTTIGSDDSRRGHSALAAYLDFRNRLLFVRRHFARWLPWTVFLEAVEIAEYARLGAFPTMLAAMRGLGAGLQGRTGRPDAIMRAHTMPADLRGKLAFADDSDRGSGAAPTAPAPARAKRTIKIAISLGLLVALLPGRLIRRIAGASPRPSLTVLYYHAVPPHGVAGFARQMGQLARWARVVPADWDGDRPEQPEAGRAPVVGITFDDSFESALDHALPVLARHGFPCTIFVPTGNLGRHPSWQMETETDRGELVASADRLARLPADLVTLGSHTMTHPHLTWLPPDQARHELMQSRQDLAALTGRSVGLFAFPFGDHDAAALQLCRECGYETVFTIEPAPVVLADRAFARGRVAVEPMDGVLEFYLKATGCYRWMVVASALKLRLKLLRRGRPGKRFPVNKLSGGHDP